MAEFIRSHDWARTALGPIQGWPQSLRTAIDLVLDSPMATILLWGRERLQIYNDHWRLLMGGKHPDAFAQATHETFPEITAQLSPVYERVDRGEGITLRDVLLPIDRDGSVSDAWWDIHYVPVRDEDGRVAGILCTVVETTDSIRAKEERVYTAASLKEVKERYQALVTAGTYTIYRMSPDWSLLYQLDSDTLASTAEPIENWVDVYIPEDERPRVLAAIDEAIRTKSLFELEHRVIFAKGGIGWVVSRAVPLLGADGEIVEWFGAGRDVTDQKLTAMQLREAEEKHRRDLEQEVRERTAELQKNRDLLQATMDSSPDMIQVFEAVRDGGGSIVDFRWVLKNHAAENQLGTLKGERLLERQPGVVQEGIFDAFKRVTETGIPDQAERHYVHEQFDGWFHQSVVKLNDGVATTTKDITAWRAAQAEVLRLQEEVGQAKLNASEGRLAAIFANAPVGLSEISMAGQLLRVNSELCRILGRTSEELLGLSLIELTHPDDVEASLDRIDHAAESGEARTVDKRYRRPDGTDIWASSTVSLLRDGKGRPESFLVVTADLTERRAAEEALRASTARQQILLGELQHRVRNVLAVTRSIISRSNDGERCTEDYVQHLQGRISALARTQVLLTRDAGAGVDLQNMILDELLSQAASEEQFAVEGPDVVLSARAAEVLTLAVHELATNATKYGAFSQPGAQLDVTWRVEPRGGQNWLLMRWRESGVSIVGAAPRRSGFGAELISRRIPYELKGRGTFDLEPGGLVSRIEFPLVPGDSILQTGEASA